MSFKKLVRQIGTSPDIDSIRPTDLNEKVVTRLFQIGSSLGNKPNDVINAVKLLAELASGKYEEVNLTSNTQDDIDSVKEALEKINNLEDLEKLVFRDDEMDGVI